MARFLIDVHQRRNRVMRRSELEVMEVEELWSLHECIGQLLAERLLAQKRNLEERLLRLDAGRGQGKPLEAGPGAHQQRQYRRILPKYRNPSAPEETWSGRGKRPRWLVSALMAGAKIEDFEVAAASPR
jgi:DNA-binding protein H-NS